MIKEAEMWRPIVSVLSFVSIAGASPTGDQVRAASLERSGAMVLNAATQREKGIFTKRPARLDVREVSLASGLSTLQERSGVPLAYSPSRVDGYDGVTCACLNATVGEALDRMLARTPFDFAETAKWILIFGNAKRGEPRGENGGAAGALVSDLAEPPPYVVPVVRTATKVWTRQGTITGRVTEAQAGTPLQGARVSIVGSALGSITDADGRYVIQNVPDGDATVQVELLAYLTTSQNATVVTGETITLDFQLAPDPLSLDEIVVTALGVERQVRSLTYSTQAIDTRPLKEARELNVINSLQGKVAGLSINQAAMGVGADSRVILRGNRSISGSSEPLYVLDGVPISGQIRDINPDDIASIDVLKGPNAAALYGSAAQNGAIVITTNRGTAGPGVQLSMSQTLMFEEPILADNYQNVYGQGTGGIYNPNSEFSWGPRMDGQMVDAWTFNDSDHVDGRQYALLPQPGNIRDAFETGYNSATNVAAGFGNEETQAHVSYTFTDARGMVPGNSLSRHNISVSVNSQPLPRLSVNTRVSYMRRAIENQLATGENFTNPLRHIYRLPRNIRTADLEPFEYTNVGNENKQNYFNVGSNGGANPYWTLNRNQRENARDRLLGLASATYSFTDAIRLMARASYDGVDQEFETRLFNDTYVNAPFGSYALTKTNSTLWNGDLLLTYAPSLGGDWSVEANVGGNLQQSRNTSLTGNTGSGLIVPNFFTLSNSLNPQTTHSIGSPVDVHSLYGFGQIGWRDALFLNVSGRNDWSSTLPAGNRSYFYPSVGLSAVVTDLYPALRDVVSSARLRASWARVGSGTGPFRLTRLTTFLAGGNNGFLRLSTTLPNENLRPEQTESIEIGADLALLNGRLGLDFTWYKMNTTDQLFTVALPVGSGASQFFTNGGDVENKGVEVLFRSVPVELPDFRWEVNANFSRNRNLVKKLNDERPSLQTASDFLRAFRIEEGKPFGQVYSRGFRRDSLGRVLIGSNGVPLVENGQVVPVANFSPDWMGGISSTVQYKNFQLNFLIDHRQGGTIASLRNAILDADGLTTRTLDGREGGLIFGENFFAHETAILADEDGNPTDEPNNLEMDAETFWRAVGGRNAPVGEAFVEDATNTRLREVTLGYTFPAALLDGLPFSALTVSLVGRNLFFIHRASKNLDPDILVNTAASAEGFESFTPPTARSFGLNVRFNF